MEIRGWARLILGVVARANLEEWGVYSNEPRCWLVSDLACAIWLED